MAASRCTIAALALSACAQANAPASDDVSPSTGDCRGKAGREIAFDAASDLRLQARVRAQSCAQAAVLVTMREPDGRLVFTDAFPLKALALTDPPSPATLGGLLSSFEENIVLREAGEMQPYDAATTVGADNPTPMSIVATKRAYERARRIGGTLVCFPVHYETTSCVWRDPEHGGAYHLYYSGG